MNERHHPHHPSIPSRAHRVEQQPPRQAPAAQGYPVAPRSPWPGIESRPLVLTTDARSARRSSVLHADDQAYDVEDDDRFYERRPRSSVRRWHASVNTATVPMRRTTSEVVPVRHTVEQEQILRPQKHWLFYVGMTLVLVFVSWVLLSLALAAIRHGWDDLRYDTPRASHLAAVVGHNHDSAAHPSYLEVINDEGRVQVFELPAGDPSKAKVYVVAQLQGEAGKETPVTLKLVPNGTTSDLEVDFGDSAVRYHNTGDGFAPEHS